MFDLKQLKADQQANAQRIVTTDQLGFVEPLYIAGADVGFKDKGAITRGVIAVLSYPALELVEYQIAQIETKLPYIPGFLSYREFPALQKAWQQLTLRPQLVLVDGHGIAHPRGVGIASHFGLLINIPTIGVAKNCLYGEIMVGNGDCEQLVDKNRQIGWVWKSKKRCNPLYISSGYRISQQSALQWVQRCIKGYRLPEPIRWADAIASERIMFKKWKQIEINNLMN